MTLQRGSAATLTTLPVSRAGVVASNGAIPTDPVVTLPLASAHSLLVDDAHQHVFVSGVPSSGTGGLLVLDRQGTVVATITDEAGASGMALDGDTLYVARCNVGLIDTIDTETLTRTASLPVHPGPSGSCALAVAGGRIWYSHDQWGYLTSMDEAAPHAVTEYTGFGLIYAPGFAANPSKPGRLLVGETDSEPGSVWSLDVSTHTPSVIGTTEGSTLDGRAMRLTSDGAFGFFSSDEVDLSNFEVTRQYAGPRGLQPVDIAVTDDDGYVAGAGVDDGGHGRVYVYKRGADAPVRSWDMGDFFSGAARFRIGFGSDDSLFMVSWDPVYETRPVQFQALSHATSQPTTIGLQTSRRTVTAGRRVRLSAQLGAWGSNHTVQFYATPLGRNQRLIGSATIDRNGTASILVKPKRQTIYTAAWTGDASYAAAVSPNQRVNVRVAMTGKLSNYSSTSAGYRIYPYTSRCPTSGRHCPVYTTEVSPNHAGKVVLFRLQVATASGWRLIGAGKAKLSARSRARAIVPYTAAARGHRFRIAAWFGGDSDHLGNHTRWARFTIS
ncbi:MAG TPA: hypothetical protein VGC71_04835 [Gaiellales bacterium]